MTRKEFRDLVLNSDKGGEYFVEMDVEYSAIRQELKLAREFGYDISLKTKLIEGSRKGIFIKNAEGDVEKYKFKIS